MSNINIKNLLVICIGNICRSPTAEKIFTKKLNHIKTSSAGINALDGNPINKFAFQILEEEGYKELDHSARTVNIKMLQEADLVLVMEKIHQQKLIHSYPQLSGKIMLLGKWQNNIDISDPYGKSYEAFQEVFKQINQACVSWSKKLI